MATFKSDFLHTLEERGFIQQCTDAAALDARLARDRVTAYIGFDATAPSLHAGSLIQIMALRWLQKTGHKPIVLMGGGTTKIGDPSGKDEARALLTAEDIGKNVEAIKEVFTRFLTFGAGTGDALLADNAEWLDGLRYIDFLREAGRYFSVGRMLTQDSVKLRLERQQNLSLLEFNYMVLQAYDFVELHKRYGCALQIGGSDQWGNIVMGIDLQHHIEAGKRFRPLAIEKEKSAKVTEVQPFIQSKRKDMEDYSHEAFMEYLGKDGGGRLFGLTTPLLTTAAGAKMGKTAGGAVWLSKEMLAPYDYWQYWRNTEDADVGKFLRLFTELPLKEIVRLEALKGAEINEAKKILANAATALCHGGRAAKQAAETAQKTFEEGGVGADIPVFELAASDLGKGLPAYELLRRAGLTESGGEARRLIRSGGARMGDKKISDENETIAPDHFQGGALKLSAGKKKHRLVKLT
ncbi:MAG: tyrosine--tRNA ligase [Pseudomonadota bacterium]|nr:tyrosine--tRNA ligase [Pseudomonadota bacterium]MDE3037588.1 tyrosine--tRNA ligase [Pseudomonadota bacterium]